MSCEHNGFDPEGYESRYNHPSNDAMWIWRNCSEAARIDKLHANALIVTANTLFDGFDPNMDTFAYLDPQVVEQLTSSAALALNSPDIEALNGDRHAAFVLSALNLSHTYGIYDNIGSLLRSNGYWISAWTEQIRSGASLEDTYGSCWATINKDALNQAYTPSRALASQRSEFILENFGPIYALLKDSITQGQ